MKYVFYRIKSKIKDFFRERKWRRQRAKRGFCDSDVWDIHIWFTTVFPKMLQQLRETTCSYPPDMTYKEWQDVLFEMEGLLYVMEDPFMATIEDWSIEKEQARAEEMEAAKDKFFEMFSEYFYDLWD